MKRILPGCLPPLLAALLAILGCVLAFPHFTVTDPVAYQATAKYMVLRGAFMPLPLEYADFLAGSAANFGAATYDYPNYGYELLLGLIGLGRGLWLTSSAELLSGAATLLTALAAYWAGLRLLRGRLYACLLATSLCLHRLVMELAFAPLADMLLLLLVIPAAVAALEARHVAAGLLLGVGFFFREHGLLFLPFLPLLSPRADSLKGFMRAGLGVGAGFLLPLLAVLGLKWHFSSGAPQQNFYVAKFSKLLAAYLDPEAAERFFTSMRRFVHLSGLFVYPLLAVALLRPRLLPGPVVRLLIVVLFWFLVPCLIWAALPKTPYRYAVYGLPLLLLALGLALRHAGEGPRPWQARLRIWGPAVFAALALGQVALETGGRLYHDAVPGAFTSPVSTVRAQLEGIDSLPLALARALPRSGDGKPAVVLADERLSPLALMSLDFPVTVKLPSFEEFFRSAGNEAVDALLLAKNHDNWNTPPVITDARGVRFRQVELPLEYLRNPVCFYVREEKR